MSAFASARQFERQAAMLPDRYDVQQRTSPSGSLRKPLVTAFQTGTNDLLNEPVFSAKLVFSAVDETHELVEGPGFLDSVDGAEGRHLLSDV